MNDKTFLETRELILLSLAATDTPMVISCPSEETLARFIEGGLTGQGRERLLAHLNRCASCYHHWLEAASFCAALSRSRCRNWLHDAQRVPAHRHRVLSAASVFELGLR